MPMHNVTFLMTQGRNQPQTRTSLFFQDMWRKDHAHAGEKLHESIITGIIGFAEVKKSRQITSWLLGKPAILPTY
jgi:hypothetical protein